MSTTYIDVEKVTKTESCIDTTEWQPCPHCGIRIRSSSIEYMWLHGSRVLGDERMFGCENCVKILLVMRELRLRKPTMLDIAEARQQPWWPDFFEAVERRLKGGR